MGGGRGDGRVCGANLEPLAAVGEGSGATLGFLCGGRKATSEALDRAAGLRGSSDLSPRSPFPLSHSLPSEKNNEEQKKKQGLRPLQRSTVDPRNNDPHVASLLNRCPVH